MHSRSLVALFDLLIACAMPAFKGRLYAQDGQGIVLEISRDFGYGMAGQMQGTFSYQVTGPPNLQHVEFLVDGRIIGQDGSAPFAYRFRTGDFGNGPHTLTAIGYTASSQAYQSNPVRGQFVSALSGITRVILSVALILVFRVVSGYLTRTNSSVSVRQGYSLFGGPVCPNCGRPFIIHWWGVNLVVGRLDRCPSCGKWRLVGRGTPESLRAAAAFERELDDESREKSGTSEGPEAHRRRWLDEPRFEDV